MSNEWYLSDQLKAKEVLERISGWDPANTIGGLEVSCSCGKTTSILNGNLQESISKGLDLKDPIESRDTTLLIARSAPINQLLKNPRTRDLVIEARDLEATNAFSNKDLVSLGTVQSFTNAYNDPTRANQNILYQVRNPRRLLTIDEAHLLQDVIFNPEMSGFIRHLEALIRDRRSYIVLVSATLGFVRDYLFNPSIGGIDIPLYDLIGKQLPTINSPHRIELARGRGLTTVFRYLDQRIDSKHKALFIARSANEARKIVQERNKYHNDAALAVSENNRHYNEMDLLNDESIAVNNRFREGINLVVGTNIYEAGIELKDPYLKLFATDSNTEVGIVQGISRARDYPLDLVVIAQNGSHWRLENDDFFEILKFLKSLDPDDQRQLGRFFEEQEIRLEKYNKGIINHKDKLHPLVYLSKGKYQINNEARIAALYKINNAYSSYDKDMEQSIWHYEDICSRYDCEFVPLDPDALKNHTDYEKRKIEVPIENEEALTRIRKEDFEKYIGSWFDRDSEETKELQEILKQKNLDKENMAISGLAESEEVQEAFRNIGLFLDYRRKQIKGRGRKMRWSIVEISQ